jgi:hypothetical protein
MALVYVLAHLPCVGDCVCAIAWHTGVSPVFLEFALLTLRGNEPACVIPAGTGRAILCLVGACACLSIARSIVIPYVSYAFVNAVLITPALGAAVFIAAACA